MTRDEAVGLELEHDTAPGTVVLSAVTISQDLSHTFHVPLTDPQTLPSATGGYFWRVEDGRNTLVVLKNMTDERQRYNLIVRHAEGQWVPGLRTLEPHQSVVLDVGLLRMTQQPDATGETIPMTVSSGQVHWSVGAGSDGRAIVGRIEQVDLVRSVSATYACPQPTNDIYVDSWMDPDYWGIVTGDTVPFAVWETDEDAFGGGPVGPYEITDILFWQSSNTAVAQVVGPGLVYGAGNGFTGIRASGASNGWEAYDPEGEDPENHVPIDLWGDAEVQWCEDQTRSVMKEEYRGGQVAWTPDCSDFTDSGGSTHFSWSELNGGFTNGNPHSPWSIVRTILTDGLEDTRTNYNRGGIQLTSGYRCPHGNANVGGVQQSRHMFGVAADMYSAQHQWTEEEFDLLRNAANLTNPDELFFWHTYTDHHLHAAW